MSSSSFSHSIKDLILKNVDVIGEKELDEVLSKKNIKVYWGTAPTGRIHLGYFVPLLKISELIEAECFITILIADIHAFMDGKSTENEMQARIDYYQRMITSMLQLLNVDLSKITFKIGSQFQLSEEYTMASFRAHSIVSQRDAAHAGSQVVKQSSNPTMNSLMYPTLQALDDHFLECDIQLGGIDQRKIFAHSRTLLGKMYGEKKIYLMNKMAPGLSNVDPKEKQNEDVKMSSSDPNSNIDILDNDKTISKKIGKCYCLDRETENTLFPLLDMILFPVLAKLKLSFDIDRPEKYGGILSYSSFEVLKRDFEEGKLVSADLKSGISSNIIKIISQIRNEFESEDNKQLLHEAYG